MRRLVFAVLSLSLLAACGTAEERFRCDDCTSDVVAACFNTGHVVGLHSVDQSREPSESAPNPQALASVGNVLLVADAFDKLLYQANLADLSRNSAAPVAIGGDARDLLVDGRHVYVVNAGDNTVQVLYRNEETLEPGNAGFTFKTVGEVNLGANTNPQAVAKVGDFLYVPLYGTFTAEGTAAGQKVVQINVKDPAKPAVAHTWDLTALNLEPTGASSTPRPSWIVAHNGQLFVALNNLDGFSAGGPGMLAKLNPDSKAMEAINLGGDECINAGHVSVAGERLIATCTGDYAGGKTALVLLDGTGKRLAAWAPTCTGQDCTAPALYRATADGNRVYVGDANSGRVFIAEIANNAFVEVRGFTTGGAVNVCPAGEFYTLVSDLLTIR